MSNFESIKKILNENKNSNWFVCHPKGPNVLFFHDDPNDPICRAWPAVTAFCTAHDGKPLIVKFDANGKDNHAESYQVSLEVYYGDKVLTYESENGPFAYNHKYPKNIQMAAAFDFIRGCIQPRRERGPFYEFPGRSPNIPPQLIP